MEKEQRTSIIDTLTLGYGLVNHRPWFIAVPVILDLFLWLGPRLSIQPAMEALADIFTAQGETNEVLATGLRQAAAQSDLFGMLAVQVPSLIRGLNPDIVPMAAGRAVLTLPNVGSTLIMAVLLVLIGLGLTVGYLTPIAQTVRHGRPDLMIMSLIAWRSWLRLVAFAGLLIGTALAVTVPLSVLAAMLALVGLNILVFLILLVQVAAIWLVVYLYFVPEAIVVSEVGPLRAIQYSIAVVRNNFWPAIGLILLIFIISAGLTLVLEYLARHPVGMLAAIAAHAYIGSGLVAATMIFYRDRLARWQQQHAGAISRPNPDTSR